MALIRGDKVSLSFGTHILLDKVDFSLEAGAKIAIVGRNGAGKSSLMKLIAEQNRPDGGHILRQKNLRVRYLAQALPEGSESTVFDFVANGVKDIREAYDRYQSLIESDPSAKEVAQLHDFLDHTDGWHWQQKVERVLTRLNLDGSVSLASLSGGWRRRVSLAECLAAEPDVLLLDEPTNHLDLETIEWLEESLKLYNGALLLISHDRQFIDALVNSMWEVDRGMLREFPAPYDQYVAAKTLQLEEEEKVNSEFDKRLAKEEVWIRQGIKARRTRNEGRVRALKKLRQERKGRVDRQGVAQLAIKSGGTSGKLVANLEQVSLSRGDKLLFEDFTTTILKGDKIGILGPNGCGKSSLIKLILGEIKADIGTVELGTQLEVAYFDQLRSAINPNLTIIDNIGEGRDFLEVNGEKKHVISYLSDYGFGPERMRTPASSLSGGEVSRLVLAKLFTKSANLLILDEPTNDLDVETLELLESQVLDYAGTVIVISHDRRFLDNVATSLWVFEKQEQAASSRLIEIEGGFSDYQRYRAGQKDRQAESQIKATAVETKPVIDEKPKETAKSVKLSYKLQRELDLLPEELEKLEKGIDTLEQKFADPAFGQSSQDEMTKAYSQMAALQEELETKLNRWEELESMKNG